MTVLHAAPVAQWQLRAARIVGTLAILFLLVDGAGKVLTLAPVVQETVRLGYHEGQVPGLGALELLCVAAYVVPRTAVLGAILLTGYLGGAVATHVRHGSPWFTHVLFPVYVALLVWGALFLRDDRLRGLVPLRGGARPREAQPRKEV